MIYRKTSALVLRYAVLRRRAMNAKAIVNYDEDRFVSLSEVLTTIDRGEPS